ncbi:C45 family autoproteolytic acyltransferase/hydolase [Schlesneria sp. DSM 10557]|uniref:C45 family autoproteolytic acyltransferase/hydolase n=1 Tax=Schlesneria sp. DSM 10557 TaxID=3044399 RepID=UPI00359F1807
MIRISRRSAILQLALVALIVSSSVRPLRAQSAPAEQREQQAALTIARCGQGWLETIDGYPVLHLKGTPYEMGFQHGALLREHCRQNMKAILVDKAEEVKLVDFGPIKVTPRTAIDMIVAFQQPHVAPRYFEEMDGLAAGSGLPVADVLAGNFIPELFHCSGFALAKSATQNGNLLHGRVLDYAIDWGLQDHAVIVVYEPDGRLPWVNVSYAGFIGSVTGMNIEQISVGEMGGGGLGHWNGRPMALLVRDALETASSLDEAIATFRDGPRTCQYYYVIADGKTNEAVGMEASWDVFSVIEPGESHPLLPNPVKDCVLLSAGDRYQELTRQAQTGYGTFTAESALRLMDRPIAMKSNLHNVLFEPATSKFWVANATSDKKPAAEQPYAKFQLSELLKRRPDPNSRELPKPDRISQRPVSSQPN